MCYYLGSFQVRPINKHVQTTERYETTVTVGQLDTCDQASQVRPWRSRWCKACLNSSHYQCNSVHKFKNLYRQSFVQSADQNWSMHDFIVREQFLYKISGQSGIEEVVELCHTMWLLRIFTPNILVTFFTRHRFYFYDSVIFSRKILMTFFSHHHLLMAFLLIISCIFAPFLLSPLLRSSGAHLCIHTRAGAPL